MSARYSTETFVSKATGRRTTVVYATAVEPDGHEVVTIVGLVMRREVSPRRYVWRTDDASHAMRSPRLSLALRPTRKAPDKDLTAGHQVP